MHPCRLARSASSGNRTATLPGSGNPMPLIVELGQPVGQLPARGHAELAERVAQVVLDGLDADHQLVGDLAVAAALRRPAGRRPAPARSGRPGPGRGAGRAAGRTRPAPWRTARRRARRRARRTAAARRVSRSAARRRCPARRRNRPAASSIRARSNGHGQPVRRPPARARTPPRRVLGAAGRRLDPPAGPGQPGDRRAAPPRGGPLLVRRRGSRRPPRPGRRDQRVGVAGPATPRSPARRRRRGSGSGGTGSSAASTASGVAAGLADPGPGHRRAPQPNARSRSALRASARPGPLGGRPVAAGRPGTSTAMPITADCMKPKSDSRLIATARSACSSGVVPGAGDPLGPGQVGEAERRGVQDAEPGRRVGRRRRDRPGRRRGRRRPAGAAPRADRGFSQSWSSSPAARWRDRPPRTTRRCDPRSPGRAPGR